MKKLWFLFTLLSFTLYGAVYEKYLVKGNPKDEEIMKLMEMIKENPNVSEYHNNLGVLLMDKKFPNDALKEFKRAIKLDKKNYRAWYNLGILYEAMGKNFKAYRTFKKALKNKRGDDLTLYHMGMFWESLGWKNKAIKYYVKALSINQEILKPSYNPPIIYNKILPQVFAEYYKKYKTASLQSYTKQKLPEIKKEEKAPEQKLEPDTKIEQKQVEEPKKDQESTQTPKTEKREIRKRIIPPTPENPPSEEEQIKKEEN